MKRFIIIVIDSFGVGAMDDCAKVRPSDVGANTAAHLIGNEKLRLKNLESLGLMNAIGFEMGEMKFAPSPAYAVSRLAHFGADTFQGHQEIMGTKPKTPVFEALADHIDELEKDLLKENYSVKRFSLNGNTALIVNDCIFIGDNMETDAGQVINVSATFAKTTFEETKKVGAIVRHHFKVSRIIALGGEDVEFGKILASAETKGRFIGLDTPKSGVYEKGYLVQHIGYGVEPNEQVNNHLNDIGVATYMYGKAADIIANDHGVNFCGVDTAYLLNKLIEDLSVVEKDAFFCLNVQETDLAGHRCDAKGYADVLKIVDEKLGEILARLKKDDCLIVMADHGNDPYSGSSLHTRENVPVLIKNDNIEKRFYGLRDTMADVGQTAAKYFGTELKNGKAIF